MISQLIGKECPNLEYMKFLAECQADIQSEMAVFQKKQPGSTVSNCLDLLDSDDEVSKKTESKRHITNDKKAHMKEAGSAIVIETLMGKPL